MKSMSYIGFKVVVSIILACAACVGCNHYKAAVNGKLPNYWEQNVYGDSLSVFPSHGDYDVYPFGMEYQPLDELTFLSHTVMDNYWKSKHILSFRDGGNHLVFEKFRVDSDWYRFPIVYANITDSKIRLEKGIHTGLRRADVLHRLELDSIADNIQKVCLTTNYDASTTFYFADGLLTRIVIRTDRELLRNPDPVFEQRYAGQVVGYTGKKLYVIPNNRDNFLSDVCLVNEQGDTIVPYGRFSWCVSDSISPIGFVLEPKKGIACVNTEGQVLCRALEGDFVPDCLSEGHFRIVNDEGLIGFADSLGHIVITPQFKCAYPFREGKAKVAYTGQIQKDGPHDEHGMWVSDDWFYIDHQGRKL